MRVCDVLPRAASVSSQPLQQTVLVSVVDECLYPHLQIHVNLISHVMGIWRLGLGKDIRVQWNLHNGTNASIKIREDSSSLWICNQQEIPYQEPHYYRIFIPARQPSDLWKNRVSFYKTLVHDIRLQMAKMDILLTGEKNQGSEMWIITTCQSQAAASLLRYELTTGELSLESSH